MGWMKHEYHDEIVKSSKRPVKAQNFQNAAEDEHYAEQRRKNRDARRERDKNIPTAPSVEPKFEGRRLYPADPATDAKRFEQVCREADKEAIQKGMNIVVFKNREGNYFTWEKKYIGGQNQIEALYVANVTGEI